MELLLFSSLAIIVGIMVGLLPALPTFAAPLIILPFAAHMPAESIIMIWILALVTATFFSSVAVITTQIPGEENALIYLNDLNGLTIGEKLHLIKSTAMGSLIAGLISAIIMFFLFHVFWRDITGVFSLAWVQALVYGILLAITVELNHKKWFTALLLIVVGLLLSTKNNYAIPSWWIWMQHLFVDKTLFSMTVALLIIPSLLDRSNKIEAFHTRDETKEPFPWWVSLRSSVIGFFVGIIPGPATYTSSYIAYLTTRGKKNKIIAAETANNAGGLGSTLPLIMATIPTNQNALLILTALEVKLIEMNQVIWERGSWGFSIIDQVLLAIVITSVLCYFLSTNFLGFYVKIIEFFNKNNRWMMALIIIGLCAVDIQASDVNPVNYIILTTMFTGIGLWLRKRNVNPMPLIFSIIIGDKIVWSFIQLFKIYF